MTFAVRAKKCRMQAIFHTFASAVFKISNKQHVQACAGVPEGAAVEAFIEKLDACLLELECGLLVNITEVYSMSRISHVIQAAQYSMKDSGHMYTCVHTDLKPYAMKCT